MQLFNGDCFEVMKNIPDKSVDFIQRKNLLNCLKGL